MEKKCQRQVKNYRGGGGGRWKKKKKPVQGQNACSRYDQLTEN